MVAVKNEPNFDKVSEPANFNKEEVGKMIREAFADDRRKNKIEERIEEFVLRVKDLESVVFSQEQNIKCMNEEFTNTINNQANPRIRKLEAGLADLNARIDPNVFTKVIKAELASELELRLSQTRLLQIRNCNKQ
jgi:hypothetical protein